MAITTHSQGTRKNNNGNCISERETKLRTFALKALDGQAIILEYIEKAVAVLTG